MKRHDAALARLAAEQIGLATLDQLHEIGISDQELKVLRREGVVESVHRGVVRHAAVPYSTAARVLAATMGAGPTAVASHRSAAMLQGYELKRYRPEITVCDSTLPRLDGVTVHRTTLLDPIDVTSVQGIPCTTRARTALDLGAVLPWEVYRHVLQVAVIARLVTEVDLAAILDRVGRRGRGGTAKLRTFLRECVPDERLASILELLLLEIIREANLPEPILQYELVCADGRVVILDFAWPQWKLAIEANGHRWHATSKQLASDEARRRSIHASGWLLDGYGWSDCHEHRARTRAELLRTLSLYGS